MNLVFNKWDNNGNPFPNLSELHEGVEFPFFINDINFNIKKCKPSDINKNEKFYFIITWKASYHFYIRNGDIFLPKEIEKCIDNFDLKVIFLCETESPTNVDIFLQLLIRKIKKNTIPKVYNESTIPKSAVCNAPQPPKPWPIIRPGGKLSRILIGNMKNLVHNDTI